MTWLTLPLAAATLLVALEPRALGGLVDLVKRAGRPVGLGAGLGPRVPFATSVVLVVVSFGLVAGVVDGLGGGVDLPPYRFALAAPLLVLAVLDARAYWLPFSVTVPLVGLGLASASLDGHLAQAIAGCLLWGAIPWLLETLFRRFRGFPGLGFGDIVLMGAVGAWAGATAGAIAILIAALVAIAMILLSRISGLSRGTRMPRIPLGSFLCLGLWATVLLLGSTPVELPPI